MKTLTLLFISFFSQINTSFDIESGVTRYSSTLYRKEIIFDGEKDISFNRYLIFIQKPCMYTDIIFKFDYKGFYLKNSLKTDFEKSKEIYFKPLMSTYNIDLGYEFKNLKIGYNHECTHQTQYNKNMKSFDVFMHNSYDKIYLKFHFDSK